MKKLLTITLAALMLLTAFTSCRLPQSSDYFGDAMEENPDIKVPESEVMQPDQNDPPSKEDGVQPSKPIDPAADVIDLPATDDYEAGSLAVKYKIFTYQDHNLVVMKVNNHSEQPLTLTIKGTCKDTANADNTMTITKKFEGFAANWENYVLFYPEFAFDNFEYELEFQTFSGEPYSQYIKNLKYDGLWLSPRYYYDERGTKVLMNSGWTFDYTHNQDAWYAAEFVYFDMNGQQDVFDAGTAVVLLDCVADDGFSPLEEKHGTYHNLLHRMVGVDVNTDFQTLGFSYNNSLGENCAWFPEYDTVIPYNPPEPFDDFRGIICWNGIAKYGTQPPMGDFTYWPNWIEHTPPPS